MRFHNQGGRHAVEVNNPNVSYGPDGGLIVHGRCSVWPCEKNRPGNSSADHVPDALDLEPGDAAVSFRARGLDDLDERVRRFGAPGRSIHSEAMAICSVDWAPTTKRMFRPPAIGRPDNLIVRHFRTHPIPLSRMHLALLPSKIDLGLLVPDPEQLVRWCEDGYAGFSGDVWSGWSTDTRTPDLQHPGYGTDYAALFSISSLVLASTLPTHRKHRLASLMVQRGIDLAAAFADGRENQHVDGGHMWGRWPLVALAGLLLGIGEMVEPPPDVAARTVERQAFYAAPNAWWWGLEAGWRRGWTDDRFLHRHPATWTTGERGERWAISYLEHIAGAHVGAVLLLTLMGAAQRALGPGLALMVRSWMRDLPADAAAALSAVGCGSTVAAWGRSYSGIGYGDLAAKAWRQVGLT